MLCKFAYLHSFEEHPDLSGMESLHDFYTSKLPHISHSHQDISLPWRRAEVWVVAKVTDFHHTEQGLVSFVDKHHSIICYLS